MRHTWKRESQQGQCITEVSLLAPWIFFIVIGTLDCGLYSYALITTQNAARAAAEYTSTSSTTAADSSTACTIALGMMKDLPNVGTALTSCNSSPVTVTATSGTATDGTSDAVVSIQYATPPVVPLPGLLPSQLTITRTVKMRVRS